MLIHIKQAIPVKGLKSPRDVYEEFNSTVIPHKGDLIADSVWKNADEYEVIEVIIDYENNTCYVTVNELDYEVNSFDEYAKMAELHGWRTYSTE